MFLFIFKFGSIEFAQRLGNRVKLNTLFNYVLANNITFFGQVDSIGSIWSTHIVGLTYICPMELCNRHIRFRVTVFARLFFPNEPPSAKLSSDE